LILAGPQHVVINPSRSEGELLLGEGMSAEEAQRKARVAFGNRTAMEERSREVWQ
jgi:hypothetical protein